jgi:hypothetical protein
VEGMDVCLQSSLHTNPHRHPYKKEVKIGFFTPLERFPFSKPKEASEKFRKQIFLLAVKFSVEWSMKRRKKIFCSDFALRRPYFSRSYRFQIYGYVMFFIEIYSCFVLKKKKKILLF